MVLSKYASRIKKAGIFLILVLTVSSLFGYVLPLTFAVPKGAEVEKNAIAPPSHPLTGISDNMVLCTNDNRELHEIYLCGSSAERLLTTNVPNLNQIVWAKLVEGSCTPSSPNCPNTLPGCTWTELSTDTQFNITEGGQYRIFVRYNDNTTERFYFNVFANGLTPSAVVTNIDCGSTGTITVNNVPSNYEFKINGGSWQPSNTFSVNSVGEYDIQIRKQPYNGECVFELNDIAVGNNSIDVDPPTIVPITCNNAKGGIEININDASSTYVYNISQGGSLIHSSGAVTNSSYIFNDLNAGTYEIEVTLASFSNCTWNATETIPAYVNTPPSVVVTKNIDCTDGVITVTATSGTSPYEYSLNGGIFTAFNSGDQATIPIATAGAYTITTRDVSGCERTAPARTVNQETEITYTTVPTHITCNGTNDGGILVDVTDTQGYSITYSLNGGPFQTSNVFSNLTSGSYPITIRKQKAGGTCDLSVPTVTINPSTPFTASASVTQQINCSTGSATIIANVTAGGTAPFQYSLDGINFQPSADLTGLGAGNYTITIKDYNNCTTTVDQTVNAGSNPSNLTFLMSNIDCATGNTDVQLTPQGGVSPFTYRITAPSAISLPPGSDTFNALPPNTYTFEATADDGCIIVRNFTVPNPIGFSVNAAVKSNVSCATPGTADGSIELTVNNFNIAFNVTVEDGSGTDTGLGVSGATSSPITINGLAADNYSLRISDGAGSCEKIVPVTISGPPSALTVDSFNVTPMNCGAPGSVTIEASGGWGNYFYSVRRQSDSYETPIQSNKTITGLDQTDTYTILLTDINGCLYDSETFNLIDQGGPTAVVDAAGSNYCYKPSPASVRGRLKIDVSGGAGPYFYTVNNGTPLAVTSGTFTLSNLTPDDYLIEVIGSNGCKTVVADTKISGQLFALAEITKPFGCGALPDAIINVTPQNGYPPYTYRVNGNTTPVTMPFNASAEGAYTFEVTDDKGCTFTTDPVNIVAAPPLSFNHNVSNTTCGKDGTGSVQLIANGGTPPYEYAFSDTMFSGSNPPVFDNRAIFTGLNATTYYFAIRDALGCVIENEQAIIGAQAAIEAEIEKTDIQCDPSGGNQWGNIKVKNILNSTSPVTISLVRVQDPVKYAAGDDTRTWTYRRYENIDLATNSNYLNASQPTLYGTNPGFDIRMYWAYDFVVRVEDDRGCFWESSIYNITSPPIPSGVTSPVALQTCANGATYDFSITNVDSDSDGTPDLVGPFDVKLYPYQLVDNDGDGVEDDVTSGWRPFNDTENPLWDGVAGTAGNPNERDYRFTNSAVYGKLLFGVAYSVAIRDNATGCIRWRALRPVVQPPVGGITVDAVPQSETCHNARDGEVELTVTNSAPGPVNIKIYNAGNPAHTAFHYNPPTVTSTGAPFTINVPNMRVAWYVVEVEDSSGCTAGERFLIYRPKSKLKIETEQLVQPTCIIGGQVAVTAIGGWDDERYFNIRNKLRQTWHPYEYALVLDSQTPTDTDFGPDNFWTNIVPTAYDGANNVYRAYVRDGSGCIEPLPNPITFTEAPRPVINTVQVTDRCTSTTELYNVVATLTQPGTNPMNTNPVYIWDGEVTNTASKTLGPGYHTLEVRDENGCSDTQTIHIYPRMVPKVKITKTVDCNVNPDNGEIEASAYGGSGSYSFTISPIPASYAPGEEINSTGIFDRLASATNYIVTVTDVDPAVPVLERCPPEDTPAIQLDTPIDPDYTVQLPVQHISCFGVDDGKITVIQTPTADNLDVTYTFSIDGNPYQTSNVFNGLSDGPHTVSIRSSKNCIQTLAPVSINRPSQLQLSASETSTFACTANNEMGMAEVTATVDVSGSPTGTGPYQYRFNNGSYGTNAIFTTPYSTVDQTITVDVIDANGCTDQTTVTILAKEKISATISTTTPLDCVNDGVYEINIPAAFTNYGITEIPGASAPITISGTTVTIDMGSDPNTYTFLITDNDTGCTTTVSQTIMPYNTVEVSASHDNDITCSTDSDGGLNFTASNFGAGGFAYEIFETSNITTPVIPSTNSTATTAIPINILAAGTYYVLVTDVDTGCTAKSETISIQSPSFPLQFTQAITQELTCSPGSDAQLTATPEGGWGTYSFELIDTANPGTAIVSSNGYNIYDGLDSGINYQLTVTDANGCNYSEPVSIPQIDSIVLDPLNFNNSDPNCNNASDGIIEVLATRANGPSTYSYILGTHTPTGIVNSLPQNTPVFSGLVEGTYTVTAQDGYGCDTSVDITLTDPSEVIVDAVITQQTGCITEGIIEVSATGGDSGPYNFRIIAPTSQVTSWTTTATMSHQYSNLPDGTYEFEARDGNGCVSPISVIRTLRTVEPFSVSLNTDNITINCNNDADAVLVATAAGGLGEYQYQLVKDGNPVGGFQDSGIFENLGPGDYSINATGGFDCQASTITVPIIEPTILSATIDSQNDIQCYGENDATAVILPNGGVAPYQFSTSLDPQKWVNDNTLEGLKPGNYTVFVQDANGCETSLPLTIGGPTAPLSTDNIVVQNEICTQDDDGFISFDILGGTAPYEYSLNDKAGPYSGINNASPFILSDLDGGGGYLIFIRDANGCETIVSADVAPGVDLTATYENIYECKDGQPYQTTSITLNNEELATEVMYALDTENPGAAQVSNVFENLTPGDHFISIIHEGGCVGRVEPITIEAPDPLRLTAEQRNFNEITAIASGGDGDYTYYLEDTPGPENIFYINRTDNYEIRVIDGKGCEATFTISMEFIDIEIPNFFTPNSDGENDLWIIKNSAAYPNIYVKVFDRSGRQIKEFIGQGEWDGTYNGKDLPAGDYWYIIKLNGPNDKREFVGNMSIYR